MVELILTSTTKPLRRPDRTQLLLLLMAGDIHPNPGHTAKYPCPVCARDVTSRGVSYRWGDVIYMWGVSLDSLCRWQIQVSVYCAWRIPADLRCTQCSILLHLMDICFLTCICLWQISQIQTCLFKVVGSGLVSTSPTFVSSSVSHPAGPHGWLAPKTVNRGPITRAGRFDTICTAA